MVGFLKENFGWDVQLTPLDSRHLDIGTPSLVRGRLAPCVAVGGMADELFQFTPDDVLHGATCTRTRNSPTFCGFVYWNLGGRPNFARNIQRIYVDGRELP